MKQRLLDGKKLEWVVLLVFLATYIIITIFHEPWFDEAQAWEIAKGASIEEILFTIPHYEGHPPLWHLILAIPAKIGVPYEIGLKTIGAIISFSSVVVILFISNLPRFVRLCLPFSYFFFYQYGVIVRPYGLMLLIMLILGIVFTERKKHPWRIVVLLCLLCLCSAYGVVIAGGIAVGLVIELIRDRGLNNIFFSFFKEQRFLSLLILLVLAILLILEFLPRSDTFYAVVNDQNPFVLCFICALFTFPAECFLTSSSWFSQDRTVLQISHIGTTELIVLCFLGVIIWILIICSASKKNIVFLVIPYMLLALFSAKVYFSGHHLGVIFMFFLFWAEFISREDDKFEIGRNLLNRIIVKETDYKLLKASYVVIGTACFIVPIVWTVVASVNDVKYNYYYSEEVAAFLEEHDLTTLSIFGGWHEDGSLIPFSNEEEDYVNTVMIGTAVPVNAYFDNNVFYNLNHGNPDKGFIYHRRPTNEEADDDLDEWRSKGYPDLIVGHPNLGLVYGDELNYKDYSLVDYVKSKFIWKTGAISEGMPIFVRNDLIDEYKLEILDGIEYTAVNGIEITNDMKERFYNGEPMEEILKPYLDAMFGEENES